MRGSQARSPGAVMTVLMRAMREHRERLLRDEAEIQTHIQHAHTQDQVALQGVVTLSF